MATIETAKAKWERKMSNAGGKWKANVTGAPYCEGFSKFLGHTPSQACAAWSAGVDATSASAFQSAVAGKGEKWAAAMRNVR